MDQYLSILLYEDDVHALLEVLSEYDGPLNDTMDQIFDILVKHVNLDNDDEEDFDA